MNPPADVFVALALFWVMLTASLGVVLVVAYIISHPLRLKTQRALSRWAEALDLLLSERKRMPNETTGSGVGTIEGLPATLLVEVEEHKSATRCTLTVELSARVPNEKRYDAYPKVARRDPHANAVLHRQLGSELGSLVFQLLQAPVERVRIYRSQMCLEWTAEEPRDELIAPMRACLDWLSKPETWTVESALTAIYGVSRNKLASPGDVDSLLPFLDHEDENIVRFAAHTILRKRDEHGLLLLTEGRDRLTLDESTKRRDSSSAA